MSPSFLVSLQIVAVLVGFWLYPSVAMKLAMPRLPLPLAFLSTAGFYIALIYFLPANSLPLVFCPLLFFLIGSVLFIRRRHRLREYITRALQKPTVLKSTLPLALTIAYSFLPFFSRWAASGMDSTMWGYLTRHLYEQQGIVPTLAPLFFVDDLKSFNQGVPAILATLFGLFPHAIERWVCLSESLGLVLFIWVSSAAARRLFKLDWAYWAGFVCLTIFSSPQLYLDWGGAPTLIGMTFGPALLLAIQTLHEQEGADKANDRDGVFPPLGRFILPALLALALTTGLHAHAIGAVTSSFMAAILYFGAFGFRWLGKHLKDLSPVIVFTLVFMAPFIWNIGAHVGPSELEFVRLWQRHMAPLISEQITLGSVYQQLTGYLHNSSATLLLLAAVFLFVSKARRRIGLLTLSGFLLTMLLLTNVGSWWLPAWYLWYPERIATAYVAVGMVAFAALFDALEDLGRFRRTALAVTGLLLLVLGCYQFKERMWPTLSHVVINRDQAMAIRWAKSHTPEDAVFESGLDPLAKWVPAIAYRATLGCHPPAVAYFLEVLESCKDVKAHYAVKEVVDPDLPKLPANARVLHTHRYEDQGRQRRILIYRW